MALGIDPKQGDQQIRATVTLPHGTGKTKRVIAFVDANNEQQQRQQAQTLLVRRKRSTRLPRPVRLTSTLPLPSR